ncbi:MAG TPA: sugar phosphate isomerase/epimerase [Candidatus Sulfotelmatobacter sp.]|nr:sugar phosphate isomerase/epimerase [Candidatus Sulfotelmatobacter sp.]
MINRRTFIGTTAAVTVSTLFTNKFAWADEEHRIEAIGLQLYTVRKNMKHDFEGTLAKVASIGYKEIEFAGYFKHTPQQVRTLIDKYSLTSPACHLDYDVFTDENLPQQIESAKVIGQSYLVNPWIPEKQRKTQDHWKRVAERFNHVGELCKNAGLEFAYHNHWFEFIPLEGKLPYDTLLESTDPNLVKMEMDLCWVTVGGGDPLKYFDRYPGRFPLVHVKDVKKLPKVTASGGRDFGSSMKDMTEVGSGIIDWKRIFAQSEKAGIKHYIVEHDQPRQPFESIKTSYEYLRQLRW